MVIRKRSNLVQVCYTKNLLLRRDSSQSRPYRHSSMTAYTSIHLVKYNCTRTVQVHLKGFDGQHDPGKLATGCYARQRSWGFSRI